MDKYVVLGAVQAENKKMCCAPRELTALYRHSPTGVGTWFVSGICQILLKVKKKNLS